MKKVVVILVLVGAGAAGGYAIWNHRNNELENGAAEIQTARAERGPIRLTVRSTGRVVSNLDVEIKCKASGQIMKLPKDVSDRVAPGELLLELDPIDENRNVQRAEVQTSASMARLAQAKLNLQTAEQQLVNDEKSARADLLAAEAACKDAQAKADRMRQLLESERVSEEECETAETAATRAEVALENAKIRLKEIDVEREALKVRRQDVVLAETQLQSDRIALDMARQRLKETKVYAPMSAGDDTATTRIAIARVATRTRPWGSGGERGSFDRQRPGERRGERPRGLDRGASGMAARRSRQDRGAIPMPPDADTATTRGPGGPDRTGFPPRGMRGERGPSEERGPAGRRPDGQRDFDRFAFDAARRGIGEGRGFVPTRMLDDVSTGPQWVVATRDVQIGQIISSPMNNVGGGTVLMTLSDLSRIYVLASVDESEIGQVALGQRVVITADAFPSRMFQGEVVRIATRGEAVTNVVTFEVKIEVAGQDKEKLKPEMTANVEIVVAEADDTLLVPAEAVLRDGFQRYVQLPGTEEQPGEKREVTAGIDDGFQIEILAGLQEGDEVVVPELGAQSQWAMGGGRSEAMRQRMRTGMMMRSMRGGRRR
jgi:HlyD family secretion protein